VRSHSRTHDTTGAKLLLLYALDTTPLVGGVPAEWAAPRARHEGARFYFAECLHAIDETGGTTVVGYGGRGVEPIAPIIATS
jgi:hypothetical protein